MNQQQPSLFVMHQSSGMNKSGISQNNNTAKQYQLQLDEWKKDEIEKIQDTYQNIQKGQNTGERIFIPFIQERDGCGNLIKKNDIAIKRSVTASQTPMNKSKAINASALSSPNKNEDQYKLSLSQIYQLQGNSNNNNNKQHQMSKISKHQKTQSLQNLLFSSPNTTRTGSNMQQNNKNSIDPYNSHNNSNDYIINNNNKNNEGNINNNIRIKNQSQQNSINVSQSQNNIMANSMGFSSTAAKLNHFNANLDEQIAYNQFKTSSISSDNIFKNIKQGNNNKNSSGNNNNMAKLKKIRILSNKSSVLQSNINSTNPSSSELGGGQQNASEYNFSDILSQQDPNQNKQSYCFKTYGRDQRFQLKKFGPALGHYKLDYAGVDNKPMDIKLKGKPIQEKKWHPDLDYIDCNYSEVDKKEGNIDIGKQLSRFQVANNQMWAPSLYQSERDQYRILEKGLTIEHQQELERQIKFSMDMNKKYPGHMPKPIMVFPGVFKNNRVPMTKQEIKDKTKSYLKKYNINYSRVLKDKFGGLNLQSQSSQSQNPTQMQNSDQ